MTGEHRKATRVERLCSAIIDYILLAYVYVFILQYAWLLRQPLAFSLVINLMIYFAYHVGIARSRLGTTPGKYLWGLAVVDAQYERPLTYHRTVARAFYALWPAIPYLLYFYYFSPHLLSEMFEYRSGSFMIWQKIQSGQVLTDTERLRWHNFQLHVQRPLANMTMNALMATWLALAASVLFLMLHPRRQALHDVICQTTVIKRNKVKSAHA